MRAANNRNNTKARGRRGKKGIVATAVAAALVASVVGGSYAAWAAGLAHSNYQWFTADPNAATYTLSTPGDVYSFAEIVNGTAPDEVKENYVSQVSSDGAYAFEGKTVQIATGANPDIHDKPDASQGDETKLPLNALGTHYEFEPIGTPDHPFQGTFEGNGSTLLNMLNDNGTYGTENQGLFGVIGEKGTARNFTVTGTIAVNTDQRVSNVGGVAGVCYGTLENVTSQVNITVNSDYEPSGEETVTTSALTNLGGVVGNAANSLSNCNYNSAVLTVASDHDAAIVGYYADFLLSNIGCIAGVLGSEDTAGAGIAASNCRNDGQMYVCLTGSGGFDSWGTRIDAKSAHVGGIVGLSYGSLYDCANTGEIRTSARNAASGVAKPTYDATNDNGASFLGGIVGSLGSGSAGNPLTVRGCYNTGMVIGSDHTGGIVGSASTYTVVTECSNGNALAANANQIEGQDNLPVDQGGVITTRWNKPMTGGIAGTSNGTISYCDNRAVVKNQQAGYYTAGICSGLGYSGLNDRDDLTVGYEAEVYGCWNAGQISPGHTTNQRFGALVGHNLGYIHDCTYRFASVAIGTDGESYPIGGAVEGKWDNLECLDSAEMKTATSTKALNAQAFSGSSVSLYWFSGSGSAAGGANYNDGYPVLTSWATCENGILLDPSRLEEISVQPAVYVDPESNPEPAPTVELSFMLDNGNIVTLQQNGDYLIVPEDGAYERTDKPNEDGIVENPTPYKYSIKGIGRYTGTILDFGDYGITTGTFEDMTVVADPNRKFNWEVQFPEYVDLYDAAGEKVDNADGSVYSYVIYDSGTNNITSELAPKYPVFDSEGYVVFDDAPGVEVPAQSAAPTINAIVSEDAKRTYKVYDRNHNLISDSDGLVYDDGYMVSGSMVSKTRVLPGGSTQTTSTQVGMSCRSYKSEVTDEVWDHNGPAGYAIEVMGKGDYEGASLEGRFVISRPSLEEDCTITAKMPGEGGLTYTYDSEMGFYRIDPNTGARIACDASAPFDGTSMRPEFAAEYLGRTIAEEKSEYVNDYQNIVFSYSGNYSGFSVVYGGPEVVIGGSQSTPRYLWNRNATTPEGSPYGASATLRYANYVWSSLQPGIWHDFEGFVTFDFDITPVSAKDIEVAVYDQIGLSEGTDAPTDDPDICSPVSLTLNGQSLKEGLDYNLFYEKEGELLEEAPTECGEYRVRVEMLAPNFTDQLEQDWFDIQYQEPKEFTVKSEYRERWSNYSGDYLVDDSTFWPGKIYPEIQFTDDSGNPLDLVFGKDFTYVVGDYGAAAYNVRSQDGSLEKLPYISGTAIASRLYSRSALDDPNEKVMPLRLTIYGKGEYAGCVQKALWLVKRLDITDTPDSDWEYELEDPVIYSWHQADSMCMVDHFVQGWVKYKGEYIKRDNSGAYAKQQLSMEPLYVEAGDSIQWIVNGSGALVGSKPLPGLHVVKPRDINDTIYIVRLDTIDYTYNGASIAPAVREQSNKITFGRDFTVTYDNNVDAGVALVTLEGIENYTGRRQANFVIAPRSIKDNKDTIVIDAIEDQRFTGEPLTPEITITDNGLAQDAPEERKHLVQGVDFTVSYAANTDVGTAIATIQGIGNYTGTIQTTFSIVADESNVSYYVEYVDALNTSRHIAPTARIDGGVAGQQVEIAAPAVMDVKGVVYRAIPVDAPITMKTITLSATQKNTVTFVYLRDGATLPEDADGIAVDISVYDANWYAAASAKVYPEDADQSVSWATSDTTIAQINTKGWILASDETDGVVEITATATSNPEISGSERLAIVGRAGASDAESSGVKVADVPSGSVLEVAWKANPGVSVGTGEKVVGAYDVNLYAMEYLWDDEAKRYVATGNADKTLPIQPLRSMEVSIPVPSGLDGGNLSLYHWDEALATYEEEEVAMSADGKYLSFSTDHFSLFTIVSRAASEEKPPVNPGDGVQPPASDGNGGTTNQPTVPSDQNPVIPGGSTPTTPGGGTLTSPTGSGGSGSGTSSPGSSSLSGTSAPSGGGTASPDDGDEDLLDASAGGTTMPLAETDSTLRDLADSDQPAAASSATEEDPFDIASVLIPVLLVIVATGVVAGAWWLYGSKARKRRH